MFAADVLHRARLRHSRYYLEQIRAANEQYHGGQMQTALEAFDEHWPQIQSAFREMTPLTDDLEIAVICNNYVLQGFEFLSLRRSIEERTLWLKTGLHAAQSLDDIRSRLIHLNRLGEVYLIGRSLDDSRACYEDALRLARQTSDQSAEAEALLGLGRVNTLNTALAETARVQLDAAIALFRTLDDRRALGWALQALGGLEERYGDLDHARRILEEALEHFQTLDDERRVASVLRRLGSVAERAGDYDRAIALLNTALEIGRRLEDMENISASLLSLGLIRDMQGNKAAARTLFEEALAYCYRSGNKLTLSVALLNLGWVATDLKDYAAALQYHGQSADVYRSLNHRTRLSAALLNQGFMQIKLGLLDAGEASVIESFDLLRELGSLDDQLDVLIVLSWLDLRRGDAAACARIIGMVRAHPPERSYSERQLYLEMVAADLETALSPAELERELDAGSRLDPEAVLQTMFQRYHLDVRSA